MLAMLCACSFGASIAPTPAQSKPKFEVILRVDAKKNPLGNEFATVDLRNNTDKDLELLSNLRADPLPFVDVDVRDGKDNRLSGEFHWRFTAHPFFESFPAGTIPAGKSLPFPVRMFVGVKESDLKPGKYRCRVRFEYKDVDVLSDWVTVELTEKHLADK